MMPFPVNTQRRDPYKNFKFRLKWDARYIFGGSKVSALKRTTEVIEYREGGDASSQHKTPGRTKYEPITMERGVSHDPEFEAWANKVWDYKNAQAPADQRQKEVSLQDFRRDFIIDVFNEAGQNTLHSPIVDEYDGFLVSCRDVFQLIERLAQSRRHFDVFVA